MKEQCSEVGRILLGDNIGGGAVTLRPIGFQCVGVSVSTDSLIQGVSEGIVNILGGGSMDYPE